VAAVRLMDLLAGLSRLADLGFGLQAGEALRSSALAAVLAHVDEFGRTLLKPLGAPAGKIEAFVETPFKLDNGKSIRPWWEQALT
jgi:hypothetical protein